MSLTIAVLFIGISYGCLVLWQNYRNRKNRRDK